MRGLMSGVAAAAALALGAAPAAATQTILLDFTGNICGVSGTGACASNARIGSAYGSTAELAIDDRSVNINTNTTLTDYLNFWTVGYGDLTGVIWGGSNSTGFRSEITFTPISGFEVQLLGFEAGCYLNRVNCRTMNYTVSNGGGVLASATGLATLHPGHVDVNVNSAWSTSPLLLAWGPDGYDVGLDNVTVAVRAIGSGGMGPTVVPEPASWAMLIAGFGLVGAAARRRRRAGHILA